MQQCSRAGISILRTSMAARSFCCTASLTIVKAWPATGNFLDHGYAVLLPDARAHGESGGEIATYGVKESDDIHRWVSWIYEHDVASSQCVYGFGESYGAALMLQSLAVEPRFCAVAVESPFSTTREMSYERVSGL